MLDIHYVLCVGFSNLNPARDASKAKVPIRRRWTQEFPTNAEVDSWLRAGGWVGAVVPHGCVVLDLDKGAAVEEAERLLAAGAVGSKTPHGYHLWFRLPPDAPPISAASAGMTVSGVPVTYRTAGRSQVIIPPSPGRSWIREPESLDDLPFLPRDLWPAPKRTHVHAETDDEPRVLLAAPADDRGAEVLAERWLGALRHAAEGTRANTAFSAGVVLGGLAAAGRPVELAVAEARACAAAHDAAGAGNARESLENGIRAGSASPMLSRPHPGGGGTCRAAAPAAPPSASPAPAQPRYPVFRTGDGDADADAAADAILRHFRPLATPDKIWLTAQEPLAFDDLAAMATAAFERLTWISPDSGKTVAAPKVLRATTAYLEARVERNKELGLHPDGWSDGSHPGAPFASDVPADPVGEIWELFRDFAFTDAGAKPKVFAALLSPFLVHFVSGPIPLFLFAARHPGAGKTLCATLIARIAAGKHAGVAPWVSAPEELDNAILTAIQRGKTVQIIDNIRGRLASSTLEAVATSRHVEGRVKFGSFTGARCNTIFLLTANEPQLSRDMSRRVVWIGIDRGGAPAPEGLPDVARMAIERRPRLVGAARALCERWLDAGRPTFPVRGADSFELWAEVICGILHVAGIVRDPAQFRPIDAAAVAAAADEGTIEATAVVAAWAAAEEERGSIGAWREPEEVAAFARDALPRRRGRPDLIARQILIAATTYSDLGGWRVEQSGDRKAFRVVSVRPAVASMAAAHPPVEDFDDDDRPY